MSKHKMIAAALLNFFIVAASAQMTTSGALNISPSGAATYTVPIKVPPGTAGMQPSLSLVHVSQGAGSQVGNGFSLSGLSSISRCPRTPAQDWTRGPLEFNTNDRYCLDGQRLILISGSEGANGAEYRTEFDSFSKIVAYNPTGSGVTGGPAYFIVKTKAGQALEYGQTTLPDGTASGARIFAVNIANGSTPPSLDTVVVTWALSKVSDTVGNYMTYKYANDTTLGLTNGEFYIKQIDYSGNSNKNLTPATTSRVAFDYAAGGGGIRFQAAHQVTSTVQLSKITVSTYLPASGSYAAGFYAVSDYSVAQSGDNDVDKAATVTECGYYQYLPTYPYCYSPVRVQSPTLGRGFTQQNLTVSGNWGSSDYTFVGDFNGDGISDIASANGTAVYMRLGNAAGGVTDATWTIANGFTWGAAGYAWVGDFNGDGRADIATTSGGTVYVLISTGAGFTAQTWATGAATWGGAGLRFAGDFNGDGRADLATIVGSSMYVWTSTGSAFSAATWAIPTAALPSGVCTSALAFVGDFDGDGRSDVTLHMAPCTDNRLVTLDSGDGYFPRWSARGTPVEGVYVYTPKFVGDLNGDGLADLIGFFSYGGSGGKFVGILSTGWWLSGNVVWESDAATGIYDLNYAWVGDFNGDGLADVAVRNSYWGTIEYALSTGSGFLKGSSPAATLGAAAMTRVGDFDGDGRADLLSANGTSLYSWMSTGKSGYLTQTYSNGLGADVKVTHTLLTKGSLDGSYTDVSRTYPMISLKQPTPLVTKVTTPDGMGGSRDTTYQYKGYAAQAANGRASPMFSGVVITDNFGFVSENSYSQAFPYVGYPLSTVQKKGGSVITQTINTPACIQPDPSLPAGSQVACVAAPGKLYFVYTAQSTTTNVRDITASGTAGVALPGTRTVSDMIDGFGNVGRITTTTLNADGSDSVYKKVVTNDFYNDNVRWFLGRLRKTTVATTGPDVASAVTPGSGGLPAAGAPPLPAQVLSPILSLLLDD